MIEQEQTPKSSFNVMDFKDVTWKCFLGFVHVFNRRETELHNSVSSNFPETRSEYFLFTPEITDRQGSLIRNGQKAVHTSAHRDKGTRLAYSADSRRRGE